MKGQPRGLDLQRIVTMFNRLGDLTGKIDGQPTRSLQNIRNSKEIDGQEIRMHGQETQSNFLNKKIMI